MKKADATLGGHSSSQINAEIISETTSVIIRKSDLKKVPWKNGLGVTEVIACDTTNTPFLWRLSAAVISESAPFSEYLGYNRFLTLIEGKELLLQFETSEYLLEFGKVAHFSGDYPTQAEIPKGVVPESVIKDVGLIYLRDLIDADFQVFEIRKKPKSFTLKGSTCFVYVQSGEVTASLYPGERKFKLKSGDTLRLDSQKCEEHLFLLEPKESARVVLIEISPRKL